MTGIGSSVRYRKHNSGLIESDGDIIINGGNIRARGQAGAACIGGSSGDNLTWSYESDIRQCGSVTINGGTVMANASHDAICTGRGGSITINGGDITARGGRAGLGRGNGIGPSWIASADITINGGNIDASPTEKAQPSVVFFQQR